MVLDVRCATVQTKPLLQVKWAGQAIQCYQASGGLFLLQPTNLPDTDLLGDEAVLAARPAFDAPIKADRIQRRHLLPLVPSFIKPILLPRLKMG